MTNRFFQNEEAKESIARIGGKDVFVYNTRVLAHKLNRTQECIRRWRSEGILPTPIIPRTEEVKQYRYLAAEVQMYCAMVKRFGIAAGTKITEEFKATLRGETQALAREINAAIRGRGSLEEVLDPFRLPEYEQNPV